MPRIVVAPDSFKGTISATDAAAAVREGWLSVRSDDEVVAIPQADGGEGTIAAMLAAIPGSELRDAGLVTGPDGRRVRAHWLALPDGGAVVELAVSSGLPLMRRPDPLGATTLGLGEVIRLAIESGATAVTVAVGGSASTDGGAGALVALGARLLDADGRELAPGGAALARLDSIDRTRLVAPPAGGAVVLTDVTAPLTGPDGAAAVFGPQKGASPDDVRTLDTALARFAEVVAEVGAPIDASTPGGGAAGGTSFGLAAVWGARIEPGAPRIAALTGLESALGAADLVIAGEGRFDGQSLRGKVVGELLAAAARAGTPCGVIAGSAAPGAPAPGDAGAPAWIIELVELAGSVEAAIAEPARWLREAGARAARAFHP